MFKALRDFSYANDGITSINYKAGQPIPVSAAHAEGLRIDGYIEEVPDGDNKMLEGEQFDHGQVVKQQISGDTIRDLDSGATATIEGDGRLTMAQPLEGLRDPALDTQHPQRIDEPEVEDPSLVEVTDDGQGNLIKDNLPLSEDSLRGVQQNAAPETVEANQSFSGTLTDEQLADFERGKAAALNGEGQGTEGNEHYARGFAFGAGSQQDGKDLVDYDRGKADGLLNREVSEEDEANEAYSKGWLEGNEGYVPPDVALEETEEYKAGVEAGKASDGTAATADQMTNERFAKGYNAGVLEARSKVRIVKKWDELDWPAKRALASQLSSEPVHNKEQATAAIEAELARRAKAAE